MFPLVLFLCFLLLALILLSSTGKAAYKNKKYKFPPSPPTFPFIGNLHQVSSLSLRSLRALSLKHGPLMLLHFGQVPTLVVSSADMAQEIMKKQGDIFASRPSMKADNILGYGAKNVSFAPYGDYWKNAKKLYIAHLLGPEKVRSFEQVREEQVRWVLEKIQHAKTTSNFIDLTKVFSLFAIGILGRLISKNFSESEKHLMLELIEQGSALYFKFNFEDYFPTLHYLDRFLDFEPKLKNISQRCDALFEKIISDGSAYRSQNDEKDKDFIDALLSLQANGQLEFELTKEHMKAFLLDMFGAGVHTTFRTLEWAMAELIRDHKTMKKIQEEVRKISFTRKIITREDLKDMATLKAVIKETLRLHPPAPVAVPHQSIKESDINGYTIPKGTRVLVNIWSINRDPKYWENPDDFHPERFISNNNTVNFLGNNFHLIPFGSGRRICPGIHFAMCNIEVLLANILYHFDWELPNGMKTEELDMGYAPQLTVLRNNSLCLVPK